MPASFKSMAEPSSLKSAANRAHIPRQISHYNLCLHISINHGQSCQQSSMVTLVWLRIVSCIGLTHHIPKQSGNF